MKIKFDCVQVAFESLFYKYGKLVARHPLPFLIVPFFVAFPLLGGMANFKENANTEYLYTPTNGPAKDSRAEMRRIFPENDSATFIATRKSNRDGFFQVVITASNGGNIYTEEFMTKVLTLDGNITSVMADSTNSYQDICAIWMGNCVGNDIIDILNGSASTINQIDLSYPVYLNQYFLGFQIGGVVTDDNDVVQSVQAILLTYYTRYQTDEEIALADLWLENTLVFLTDHSVEGLTLNFQKASSLDEELDKSVSGIIPLFATAYTVLMTFCVISCVMLDWVRTKIWVAFIGEIAAGMAIVSSLGLLSACGVYFTGVVATMPFLLIGIGIDDMFVMLSAWRHTDYRLSAEERMGLMMKTAAISITLTSVTDALAFLIGAITTFRSVTLFCAYTGVAVIFSYIYAITVLAAMFALSGKREEANRHEMTCMKVVPTKQAQHRSKAYQIFCTGGYIRDEDDKQEVESDPTPGSSTQELKAEDKSSQNEDEYLDLPLITVWLRDYIGPALMTIPAKIIIIVLYLAYLGVSIWGCTELQEGLKLSNLAPDDSYLIDYFAKENRYFQSLYGPLVMFTFKGSLNYSDAYVREDIFMQMDEFRNTSLYYSEDVYYDSWLISFLSFLSQQNIVVPSTMPDFIAQLNIFLAVPQFARYEVDILFSDDNSEIEASRFFVQSKGLESTLDERKLMLDSRDIAESSQFDITVYHFAFIYTDQYVVIVINTLQNIGIAIGSMLLVSLLLLPSLLSVLFVTLSVVSIIVGVVGFMVFWDVSLDSVSMINLIICIGFSVDFSAHISYHFSISKGKTGRERAIDAYGHLGTPIIQGAISTILGMVVLSTSNTYIFRTFFKIMFLVMVFGFAHAFFVLPVVLSVIGPKSCSKNKDNDVDVEKDGKRANCYDNPALTTGEKGAPPKGAVTASNGDLKNDNANNHNSNNIEIVSGTNGPPYVSKVNIVES